MNKNIIFLIFAAGLLFYGCDFLDYSERSFAEKEDTFAEFNKTAAMLTAVYNKLPNGFSSIDGAMLDAATDDAMYAWEVANIHNFYNGVWGKLNAVDGQWGNYYTAIRRANLFLENARDEILEEFKWSGDKYQSMLKRWRYYRYEARFLRAFFHFELAKRYGDIPIVDHCLTYEEANHMPRNSFKDVIEWIVRECEEIAPELAASYTNSQITPEMETGRVTKGAAYALRSRALLYLASPLHNTDNDIQLWKDAAAAAHDLIVSGLYSNKLPEWGKVFNNWKDNPELILERRQANSRSFETQNISIGYENGNSGNCATQNLVDCYEMKATGKGISEEGSGYDPSNPYEGRDPRLKMTVYCNGDVCMGRPLQCYEGGMDGAPKTGTSPSGYYLRKYINESTVISGDKKNETEHCWVLFRYTEVLLNYAEAMNEAYGPSYKDADHTLSAIEAVNFVRQRIGVGMPDFSSELTQNEFRRKIHNERRVELAFEGHRMWDLRRWKEGNLTTEIYGMKMVRDNETGTISYSPVKIADRQWEDKMYFYPIPQSEIYATDGVLKQNPGW